MTLSAGPSLAAPGGAQLGAATAAAVSAPRARDLLVFVKPHIDATFAFVGLTGVLLAWGGAGAFPFRPALLVSASALLLGAGAECWTNIRDRDIDALMPRTAGRPLVTGRISLRQATVLATVLTTAGLGLALGLGMIAFLFLVLALISNVVVYSLVTKRSTPWSIVLGSGVGSLVLWAGYAAVHAPISDAAGLLGAMVAVWVFVHIWVIALRYREDYALAGVPMAPLVWTRGQLTAALAGSALAMGALAVGALLALGSPAGRWAALPVGIISALIVAAAAAAPSREELAGPLIRVITVYLVVVLGAAIGCAL